MKMKNIEEVEITEETLNVRSRTSTKLFGLFNASLRTDIKINEEGEVTISRPWYSFLYRASRSLNDLERELKQELKVLKDDLKLIDVESQNKFQATAEVLEISADVVTTK